jgi:mRNA interferase YafQ
VRTFSRTSQFKKDFKRAENRGKELGKLKTVLDLLINGGRLPESLKDHPLRGDFAGSRDCHIEPDWVLIYTLTESDSHVRFERTGSHSDLFR